jgi:hypothetical protein
LEVNIIKFQVVGWILSQTCEVALIFSKENEQAMAGTAAVGSAALPPENVAELQFGSEFADIQSTLVVPNEP